MEQEVIPGSYNQNDIEEIREKGILERIIEENHTPELYEVLMNMPNTDFQSLMLQLWEDKSIKATEGMLNNVIENNIFVQASEVEQKDFVEFDNLAYGLLSKISQRYKSIELSPLAPFATNKLLAGISQKRVFSLTRNTEVVSDPTTILALHCAAERRKRLDVFSKNADSVAFASSHRVVRQEKVRKHGYSSHFRTFTLGVAGRDVGHELFEKENIKEHLLFFLILLKSLNYSCNYGINKIKINLQNSDKRHPELLHVLNESVFEEMRKEFPEVTFDLDPNAESKYYKSLSYRITAFNNADQGPISIVGGGITNWTEILVGSNKERFLTGSVGTETLLKHFKI